MTQEVRLLARRLDSGAMLGKRNARFANALRRLRDGARLGL